MSAFFLPQQLLERGGGGAALRRRLHPRFDRAAGALFPEVLEDGHAREAGDEAGEPLRTTHGAGANSLQRPWSTRPDRGRRPAIDRGRARATMTATPSPVATDEIVFPRCDRRPECGGPVSAASAQAVALRHRRVRPFHVSHDYFHSPTSVKPAQ